LKSAWWLTFDGTGNIGDVMGVYGGLQQPTNPIPVEITRLTGITDEMVAVKMIDIGELRALIASADLVIAYNAAFDRPFCEAFSPVFAEKAWACSVSEIDWARAVSKAPARLPDRPGGLLPRGPQGLDTVLRCSKSCQRAGENWEILLLLSSTQQVRDRASASSRKTAPST